MKIGDNVSFSHDVYGILRGDVRKFFKNGKVLVHCYVSQLYRDKMFNVDRKELTL